MKIWQCYDGIPAQQWFYTNDQRIALEGNSTYSSQLLHLCFLTASPSAQCLDLTNGSTADSNQMQTWTCTTNDNNQRWTF